MFFGSFVSGSRRSWLTGVLRAILAQVGGLESHFGFKLGLLEAILGPNWAKLGPSWTKLGQVMAKWGQVWTNLGQVGAKLGPIESKFGPS